MSDNEKIELHLDNDREWRKLLLSQNEILFKEVKEINKNLAKKCVDDEKRLTKLEVKSGFYGFIGGILSTIGINIWK